MKKPANFLSSIAIRNFKAIYDSKTIRFTPLTVFIGNNGTGKSSIIEGLETLETIVSENLDAGLQLWRGIEHIRNKSRQVQQRFGKSSKPIEFKLRGSIGRKAFKTVIVINERGNENEVFFEYEYFENNNQIWERKDNEQKYYDNAHKGVTDIRIPPEMSLLKMNFGNYTSKWQFLQLNPQEIGNPHSVLSRYKSNKYNWLRISLFEKLLKSA